MSEWNWPIVFLYAFVITGVVVAIVGFSQAPPEPESVLDSGSQESAEQYVPQNHTFEVRVTSDSVSPNPIVVNRTDWVTMNIRSIDGEDHEFEVLTYGARTVAMPDRLRGVRFQASVAGTHYIKVDGLVVSELLVE